MLDCSPGKTGASTTAGKRKGRPQIRGMLSRVRPEHPKDGLAQQWRGANGVRFPSMRPLTRARTRGSVEMQRRLTRHAWLLDLTSARRCSLLRVAAHIVGVGHRVDAVRDIALHQRGRVRSRLEPLRDALTTFVDLRWIGHRASDTRGDAVRAPGGRGCVEDVVGIRLGGPLASAATPPWAADITAPANAVHAAARGSHVLSSVGSAMELLAIRAVPSVPLHPGLPSTANCEVA